MLEISILVREFIGEIYPIFIPPSFFLPLFLPPLLVLLYLFQRKRLLREHLRSFYLYEILKESRFRYQ